MTNPLHPLWCRPGAADFDARRASLTTQSTALSQNLHDFLQQEVSALEQQVALADKKLALTQKDLNGVVALVDKGACCLRRARQASNRAWRNFRESG